jgi:hypothetical protein
VVSKVSGDLAKITTRSFRSRSKHRRKHFSETAYNFSTSERLGIKTVFNLHHNYHCRLNWASWTSAITGTLGRWQDTRWAVRPVRVNITNTLALVFSANLTAAVVSSPEAFGTPQCSN